ncbi:MAG: DUF2470 domain-containing protein [Candidatus Nanopelagicales bacterium]
MNALSGSQGWLTDDIVVAVARHMNDDHTNDSLTMVRPLCPAAKSATVVGLDYSSLCFAVVTDEGEPVRVDVPWPGELTERSDIRKFVVQLHTAACEQLGITPDDHADHGQREEVR